MRIVKRRDALSGAQAMLSHLVNKVTDMRAHELAALIDHTMLMPEATMIDVLQACDVASEFGCASVCVSPTRVAFANERLSGSGIPVCTVIGFPSGAVKFKTKLIETEQALADGATEFDMVLNLGALLDGRDSDVSDDILGVRNAIPDNYVLKVIIESAALDKNHMTAACRLSVEAGADFVKTSTGFHPAGGADLHSVMCMRETVGPAVGVKASGGIRDATTALAMVKAGANRLGMSSTREALASLLD